MPFFLRCPRFTFFFLVACGSPIIEGTGVENDSESSEGSSMPTEAGETDPTASNSDTTTPTTGDDPTTGGPLCTDLTCEAYPPRNGVCNDPQDPFTLEQFWAVKFPDLDDAFLACATADQKASLLQQAIYLGLADQNTDPNANATSCDEQALDQRIKEGPLQILTQTIDAGQSYTGGIQGVIPTKASWCGVSQKYPAAPVRVFAQKGACNPDQSGQFVPALQGVELKFFSPQTMDVQSMAVDLVNGEAVLTSPLFYGPDSTLTPFNLVANTKAVDEAVDVCLAFRTVDGDMKTKVVGDLNTFQVTP